MARPVPEPPLSRLIRCLLWLCLLSGAGLSAAADDYFPPPGHWARAEPAALGVDGDALRRAIEQVRRHENPAPRDQAIMWAQGFGSREPYFGGLLGPTSVRAEGVVGIVVHRGRVIAEFGDTRRPDMAHSIAKSVLSTVVGLAWDDRLIPDLAAPVAALMPAGVDLFDGPHNSPISWEMLLRQTSDWQGTLWGRPDWADRPEGPAERWPDTPRHIPGSRYEYNDVRINLLALAALQVWRRPLPQVLGERIMGPIGASTRWRWLNTPRCSITWRRAGSRSASPAACRPSISRSWEVGLNAANQRRSLRRSTCCSQD